MDKFICVIAWLFGYMEKGRTYTVPQMLWISFRRGFMIAVVVVLLAFFFNIMSVSRLLGLGAFIWLVMGMAGMVVMD